MGLLDILKGNAYTTAEKNKLAAIDPSNFVTVDQYNELRNQITQLIKFMPVEVDTSQFALRSEIPSVEGLATVKQIPSLPDMSKYVLKSELPDTVKYIENSNTKSAIKKISLSIEDKATFKPDSNPTDNIAHTI